MGFEALAAGLAAFLEGAAAAGFLVALLAFFVSLAALKEWTEVSNWYASKFFTNVKDVISL